MQHISSLVDLGREVAQLRKAEGLTQKQVGDLTGLGQSTLARFETGNVAEFGSRKLLRVLEVLGYELAVKPAKPQFTLEDALEERRQEAAGQSAGHIQGTRQPEVRLTVFVHDQPVATLESPDSFKHVLTYHPNLAQEQFVSLLMPVRTESWTWPEMHPFFRMNLPEGFLLSVLQEQFGPHIGGSHISLLSVVGRNAIGRVKVVPEGEDPNAVVPEFDVRSILGGDNSEAAFVQLVRKYARSGVSGVVPKFLSPNEADGDARQGLPDNHSKGTLPTERYIIKGTSSKLPGVALNEHLCMEVSRRAGIETARTEVSADGQALVVHRFDYAPDGTTRLGMEDLCSLLTLKPEDKYKSTWEAVVRRIVQVTAEHGRKETLERLGDLLLLTYALRNADCHTKNIALLYSNSADVRLAPVYDMLTITVYADYANNPPGMPIHGRQTWRPGKGLDIFLQTSCGLKPARIKARIERICEAMVDVSPLVIDAAKNYESFGTVGPRMLHAWNEGMNSLRLQKTWTLPTLTRHIETAGYGDVRPARAPSPEKIGRSELLAARGRSF